MDGLLSAGVCHSRTVQQTRTVGIILGGLMHAVCFQGLSIRPVRCFRGIYPTVCENCIEKKRFHAAELSMPDYSDHQGSAVGDSTMYVFGYIHCRMIFRKYSRFKNSEHLYKTFLGVDFFPGKAVYTRQKELGWDEVGTPSSEKESRWMMNVVVPCCACPPFHAFQPRPSG